MEIDEITTITQEQNKDPPTDKLYLNYISCLLLGIGGLAPVNTFMLAIDFYESTYNIGSVAYMINFGFNGGQFIGLIILFISHRFCGKLIGPRIVICYVMNFVMILATLLLNIFGGTIGMQYPTFIKNIFYGITMGCMLLSGVCTGCSIGTALSYVAPLPLMYTQAVVAGLSISGVIFSITRITIKSILDFGVGNNGYLDTQTLNVISMIIFFIITLILELIAIGSFTTIHSILSFTSYYNNGVQDNKSYEEDMLDNSNVNHSIKMEKYSSASLDEANYMDTDTENYNDELIVGDKTDDEPPKPKSDLMIFLKVLWKYKYLCPSMSFTYLVTFFLGPGIISDIKTESNWLNQNSWWQVLIISVFLCSDCLGRMSPRWKRTIIFDFSELYVFSVLRIIFIPVIFFMINPRYIVGDFLTIVIVSLLGVTNGYLVSVLIMKSPTLLYSYEKQYGGMVVTVFMNSGIVIGSLISLILKSVIPKFFA